jgi:DNA-binding transcriptional LysR family regulator
MGRSSSPSKSTFRAALIVCSRSDPACRRSLPGGEIIAQNETKFMESAIVLSEELSFTRAAKRLYISQPTLTKNIHALERIVGFPLFERKNKTVKVTDAGRAYDEQARLALLYGERAIQAARAVMQNADTILNVGKSPYSDPFLTSTLLSIQLPLFPRLRIELTSQYSCDLAHELLAGGLDLAIATEPPESPLLTTVKIGEAPFYIAMSKRDQLAARPSVTLNDLADRSWVIFERRLHPPVYDAVMRLARAKKIAAANIKHITAPEEAFQFVADGSSVAFLVKAGALLMARNGITVRPLREEALLLKTYLASRADNKSKVASELVRAFMRKLANWYPAKQVTLPIPA